MSKHKPIIGGIFGTHTEVDENGNVTEKDSFHLRIYWDLFHSKAIHKLKGNMLHVYLTIAMHLDKSGEGWPTQERIAGLCGISRDTVVNSIKKLTEAGFIEAVKVRKQGKFDNTVYKIKFVPLPPAQYEQINQDNEPTQSHDQKSVSSQGQIEKTDHDRKADTVENPENQDSHHVGKTVTEKPSRKNRHGKADTKEDLSSFKHYPSFKHDDEDLHDWQQDGQYIAFRATFTSVGASDIKKPEEHYNKFQAAIEKVGFAELISAVGKYLKVESDNAQVVLFLSGLYHDYLEKKKTSNTTKKFSKYTKVKSLPEAVRIQMEEAAAGIQYEELSDEELQNRRQQIQAKMKKITENDERKKKALQDEEKKRAVGGL